MAQQTDAERTYHTRTTLEQDAEDYRDCTRPDAEYATGDEVLVEYDGGTHVGVVTNTTPNHGSGPEFTYTVHYPSGEAPNASGHSIIRPENVVGEAGSEEGGDDEDEAAEAGSEDERTQGEVVVAEAQEGDVVQVGDRERGRRRYPDASGLYEVQERVNTYTLKVQRLGEQGGVARMQAHASGEGVRTLAGHNDPGVVWHEVGVQGQDVGQAEGQVCVNCGEWLDHTVPVNTGHATTGDSGCPHCHEASPVRAVSHEVGDERTIHGGYVPQGSRDHGSQVSLDAARAIAQD